MINSVQATPECGPLRSLWRRVRAVSLLKLLVLSGLLVGAPGRADAQVFAITTINNTNVLVGTPITIQITITNTTTASSQLTWSLNSNAATSATLAPTNTAPQGSTTFNWRPTQVQTVTFTVSVSQVGTFNTAGTSFTVTVTNNVAPVSQVVIDPISPQTVPEGGTLTFTSHAHATNDPNTPLLFSLINPPSGATLTNNTLTSGVFSWTPTPAQAATPSYTLREVVTVAGGSGSNSQDFQVTVTRTNDCADLDGFLAAVQQGGYFQLSNCTTIVLTNTLRITKSVTLDAGANNVTIAGNNLFRLFTVLPGVTNFTLRGITLSGGQDANGGSLYVSSGAVATLTNCTFIGNSAVGTNGAAGRGGSGGGTIGNNGGNGTAGVPALGGAIYNLGGLTIYNSSFFTNTAMGGNGGPGGNGADGSWQGGNGGNGAVGGVSFGGAIYNLGTLRLTNCTFSGNSVSGGSGGDGGTNGSGPFTSSPGRGGAGAPGSGAAVYSVQSLTAINCTFSLNVAQSGSSASGGTDTSTGNGANGPSGAGCFGGGIYLQGVGAVTNCTFATNFVIGGNGGDGGRATSGLSSGNGGNGGNAFGGGLYNTGAVVVVNCTFAGCGAVGGTNGFGGGVAFPGTDGAPGRGRGAEVAQGSGTFLLRNSILAANSAGTNAYDTSASRITDGGYNISSDASLNFSGTSLKNTDPKLGPLAANGGPTLTMALQPTSPAINKIPKASSPATDQRGIPRPQPQGGLSDIGAYELVRLPAILAQPQSQTNILNSSVTFTVTAVGGTLSYQWRFNAEDIAAATDSSYTIDSVSTTDVGDYDVVITNSFGSVTSAVASLTVLEPPEITTQPTDLSVFLGSNATFTVEATGLEPLSYQWRFNGTNLSAATAASFDIINAQLSNAGSYTVVITNVDGGVTSAPAVLTVGVSPSITAQPADQTVVVGSNATFMVTAAGTSPLSYQWRFNGANIAGATSSLITTNSANTNNAGNYDVVVTNNFGMITSHTAKLTVVVPLPLIISGRITNGIAGLGGVRVTVSGVTNSAITDFNGYYTIASLPTNTYTVTPSLACFLFSPSNQVAHVGPNNTNGVNFSASNDLHLIRGRIIEYTNGLSGVAVTVIGGGETNSLITDTNGYYTLSGLCSNVYSVTPSLRCYRFNPASQPVQLGSDTTNVNFVAGLLAYTISGNISSNGTAGLSGVRVTIGDAFGTNTVISANGVYSLSGLCPGTYLVTPSLAGFVFEPANNSITVGPDAAAVNFLANPIYNISGRVSEGANPLTGVSVTAGTNTATTDSSGNYAILGVRAGAVTVTPALPCYRFSPTNLAFTVSSNTAGMNFGAIHGFAIHGQITGDVLAGVTVSAGGKSAVTAANGSYALSNLCAGIYPVTPSLAGYQFQPGTTNVTLSSADSNGVNFAAFTLFSISGRILDGTNGLAGVNVAITNSAGTQTGLTTINGSYAVSNLVAGTYTLTPSLGCYNFSNLPSPITVGPSKNMPDIAASLRLYTISGRVTEGAGGFSGVAVQIGDITIGTDVTGYYALPGLCPGTYPVIPSFPGYHFTPGTNNVTLSSADSNGVNFAAVAVFDISGRVLEGSNGLGGVTVRMDASLSTNSVVTASDGSYAFSGVSAGSVSINPSLEGYKFQPSVFDLTTGADTNLPAFAAFPLLTISRTNDLVQLAAAQTPGRTYQLEASTNLIKWVPIFTTSNVSTNTTWFYFTDPYATNSVRFYRLAEDVVVTPVFTMTLTNSAAHFSFVAFPELTYQIESSTNLLNWQPILTTNNSSANIALFQFTDSPTTSRARFYRLSQTPGP